MEDFCRFLPKIELHAHLNGSLSEATLKSLGCLNQGIVNYQSLTKLYHKTDKTLDDAFKLFKIAHEATSNKTSVYLATKSVIDEFAADNVIYLELRTTPRAEKGMTKTEYIESVVKAIQDNDNKEIIVKLLLSIDRRHDLAVSQEAMDVILKMKDKFPEIIKGVDLSGNPNIGSFNADLFKLARDKGLFVALHCAEVKNDGEVKEMLKFRPDRIGHGTCLHLDYKGTKEIWDLYSQQPIPTECCLTSNVVSGTSPDYKQHHLREWVRNSLPFTISTDDKGVFCTSSSKEYLHAAENFGLTVKDLWQVSYNSVGYAFTTDEEKETVRKKLEDWRLTNSV